MAIKVEKNVNLAKYTTFQIGGDADFFCRVKDNEELIEAINYAYNKNISFRIIGGGANLLVSDTGYRGLIILNRVGDYRFEDDLLIADSGANLAKIARESVERGFYSLDFATNLPGTIGGAVIGNAGAYGKDIGCLVISVKIWEKGQVFDLSANEISYSYRSSSLKNNENKIVLTTTLKLEEGHRKHRVDIDEDTKKRHQDYSGANAGSYFCNIEETDLSDSQKDNLSKFIVQGKLSAGKLIDSIGLKGLKVGGAMVSQGHANVIINTGGASSQNVIELEKTIIDKVLSAYGILLRVEITKIGDL